MRRRKTGGPENTRPSLRGGLTAYARSPRSRVRSGLRHLANWRCPATRSSPDPSPQGLTVATTVRTTRFCRTQLAPHRPEGLRKASAPSVCTQSRPHEVHLALVPPSRARRCRVHRTPVHVRYDVRSPLSADRNGGENAVIPNFCKVEYFCEVGLTGLYERQVFCPTSNARAACQLSANDACATLARFHQVMLLTHSLS